MPTPFEHQKEMLAFHLAHPCTLDNSDVGVGKTPPMITWLQKLSRQDGVIRSLVICPNTITENWVNELGTWSNLSSIILRGTRQKRLDLLKQPADLYLINYEGVRVIHRELMAKGFDAVVCDEIHHIKQYKGSYSKPTQSFLVRELGRTTNYRKGMTGTLITNGLEDAWAIGKFIDPMIFQQNGKPLNFWGYRNKYLYDANAGKSWMKWPDMMPRPGAVEEIKKLFAPYTIRFEKKDVLKFLPPVLFQKRMIGLTDEQKKALHDLKLHFLTELNDGHILTAAHIGPRIQKMLEIENGFVYREGEETYKFNPNPKLKELKILLDEIGNQRVVIWVTFKEEVEMIAFALSHEDSGLTFHGASVWWDSQSRFAAITGDTDPGIRQSIVDGFNSNRFQYLITNTAVGGEGISLLCPYAIWYSRDWKLVHRLQSLGRHDRPGAEQFDNLTMIDIVAQGEWDERVVASLENKEDLLKSVTPETFRRMIQ